MAILLSSWLVAVTVRDLGAVLGFVGATGSTTICYILPGVLYWKMHNSGILRWIGVWLAAFGVVFMVICVAVQASDL